MPQRFLRPGIVTSRRFNACSWQAQSFYIRLLTLVDDFGRYEADPVILKSHAFPLHEDLRSSQVQKLCLELQANQLATFYRADGKEVLELTRWIERARAEKSKFPARIAGCEQLYAVDNKSSPPSSSSSPPSSSSPSPRHGVAGEGLEEKSSIPGSTALPLVLVAEPRFVRAWTMWLEHLRQKRKPATLHAQDLQLRQCVEWGLERSIRAIETSVEHNWQGLYEEKQNGSGTDRNKHTYTTGDSKYDRMRARQAEQAQAKAKAVSEAPGPGVGAQVAGA